jgi:N-acetylglucosamine-6-sulfatase
MHLGTKHRIALGGATLLAFAGVALADIDLAGPAGAEHARATTPGRPNIILIQTDDQTASQLTSKAMPNTERVIARHGTSFTSYIASTSQCCPSRASLLTGQYAHNHGVTSNEIGYAGLVDPGNVLPVWLQGAGYETIHVGKFLNGYEKVVPPTEVAPGWSEWYSVLGPTRYYGYDYFVNGGVVHHGHRGGDNVTHVLNRDAVKLVNEHVRKAKPFYLQLDERAPHSAGQYDPFGACGKAAIPESHDTKLFHHAAPPRPPSYNEANMTDKPAFLRARPKLGYADRTRVRQHWHCALASLAGVDQGVGRIFEAVKKGGELDRTVFIFVSDNGKFFGEHRIPGGKVFPYEEALRLPLLIRVPQRYRGGAPRIAKTGRPVANIDLAPTILDLAGAEPCATPVDCRTMDGRSLMPLLTGSGAWPKKRGLLTEYRVPDLGRYSTCQFAGIRTQSTIYVEHSRAVQPGTSQCVATDQRELYDLKADPFQLHNLCFGGTPANCPVELEQLDFERRLDLLQTCAGIAGRDPAVDGRPHCE